MMEIKFDALEKCVRLIGYWIHGDKAVIDELLYQEFDSFEEFNKELNTNFLSSYSQDSKTSLIKYYVSKFWEIQGFFEENKDILFNVTLSSNDFCSYNHLDRLGNKTELDKFGNYIVRCFFVFNMMFNDLQFSCGIYKIDFIKICSDLMFSTEYIDCSLTELMTEKRQKEYDNNLETPPTLPNKPSDIKLKKPVKTFPEYLKPEMRKRLPDLCKMLFNSNESPKEYAIMFCLLTQNDLLNIPNRSITDHFKAWYIFIDKPFPKRNNFQAINKHFLDTNDTGFLFDEFDYDYLKLKKSFKKALIDNKTT